MQSRHEEEDERSEQLEDDADAEDDLDRHARELDLGPPKPIQVRSAQVLGKSASMLIICVFVPLSGWHHSASKRAS